MFKQALKNANDARQRSYAELWIAYEEGKAGLTDAARTKASAWLKRNGSNAELARFVPWAEFIVLRATTSYDAPTYYRLYIELYQKQLAVIEKLPATEHAFYLSDDLRFLYSVSCYMARDAFFQAKEMWDRDPSVENTQLGMDALKKQMVVAEHFDSGWRAQAGKDYQVWSARLDVMQRR